MAELGNATRVYIVTGTSGNYTAMKGEQSNSVNRSAESIDVSDKDTGSWGSTIPGKKSLTVDVTVYTDNKDSDQSALLNAFYEGETMQVFIGKDGEEGELFEATIVSISDINDAGAVATRQISLASMGEPTLTI
jgi:predicted secreted protein